ncbi:hypothetical protein ALO83_103715 [Pseudomonas cannabina pv. alisalensis]|uniref:Uncharacterized protein n=1 Tax=Pseudomonas cannabina TaxID=86840 RepID=A0AB37Q3G3_PSECA|nr:hypothetical protein [Pseudomonas cannabina]KPW23135.1 hypothetical protein ALO83_103715 [Pseudomonas cannabina pv. alisalensis]RMN76630.1 hypothetical protein ALQ53_200242 [Pseudomonas cannabina]RMN81177.1 hypothetical protein ALQ52_104389 [Pseudomonas cannabina pv. alisalensis]
MKTTRYIRTEQPALLTAPVTLNIAGTLLAELNLYRQAKHHYLSCPKDVPDAERYRRLQTLEHLGEQLASTLAIDVRFELGEPPDFE